MDAFPIVIAGISHIHFTEVLLLATNLIIQRFHLNFSKIPAISTCPAAQKHQKGPAIASRTRFLLLFGHTATVALHSRTRFSAVAHIIPAPQILPKNATAGFGQGFPERASAALRGLFSKSKAQRFSRFGLARDRWHQTAGRLKAGYRR